MGRRILVVSLGATGHIMPTVELVAELVRRGHRVSYVTTDEFTDVLEGAGAEVLPYASTVESSTMKVVHPLSELVRALHENSAIAEVAKSRFADTLPDLIVYDVMAFVAGRVLSRNWRLPAVMLSPVIASGLFYSTVPAITERSPKEGNDAAPAMSDYFLGLGRFLSDYGPNIKVTDELFEAIEGLTVVNCPREFQIAGDTFDDRWVFSGPCPTDRAFQDRWQPPNEDPVLLASFGSMSYEGQRAFLKACVSAFAGLAWHVVISTGPDVDPAELGSLPPNIEAHQYVPQLTILKNAKLFISHGGMGGIMEALSLGVPILAVPQLPEHILVADRVAELGLGRKITCDISAEELRAAALGLAADAPTAQAMEQMREYIKKAGGAPRAVDEIESYMLRAVGKDRL
jgi:dTDP-L-oleandrosyltransferase